MKNMLIGLCAAGAAGLALGGTGPRLTVVRDIPYLEGQELEEADAHRAAWCRLDIRYPASVTGFSTVVTFHGGGLTRGRRGFFNLDPTLAEVAVDYRLLGREGVTNEDVRTPIYDAAAAVAWTLRHVAEYGGDPKKVFVTGSSAGGYLTMMVGMDPRWLAKYGFKPLDLAGLAPNSGQATTHFAIKALAGYEGPRWQPVIDELAPLYYCRYATAIPPIVCIVGQPPYEMKGRAEENELLIGSLKAMGHEKAWYVRLPFASHGRTTACGRPYIELMAKGKLPTDFYLRPGDVH